MTLGDYDVSRVDSTNHNKCVTVVGDAENGEECACAGEGLYVKTLYFPVKFAVNIKLL